MAKVLEINAKQVANAIKKLADNCERDLERVVAYGAKQMAKKAQRIFNRAEYDGTNDVYCYSVKATTDTNAICTYNVVAYSPSGSVAFIEFGAGTHYNSADHPMRQTSIPPMAELGYYGVDNPKNTFNKNWFGSRGQGDLWVFKSTDSAIIGRTTPNFAYVMDRQHRVRKGYYWTKGNRPARAMWGAKLEYDKKLSYWVDMAGGKK